MLSMKIAVQDRGGLAGPRPVTGGVPVREGAAPAGSAFVLHTAAGKGVPLQTRVLARWKDGSARWLLLDFATAVAAGGRADLVLSTAAAAAAAMPPAAPGPALSTAAGGAAALVDGILEVGLELTLADGTLCHAVLGEPAVEDDGPCRRTLLWRGDFRTPGGARVCQVRLRGSSYAGTSRLRLEPLLLVDAADGILMHLRSLDLVVRPAGLTATGVRLGGEPGWSGPADGAVRLFQRDDESSELQGAAGRGGKAPGWAELRLGERTVAVALRDFWQQWPKSIGVAGGALRVGLFPSFQAGDFDHMEPWYKHAYLFSENCYRLRNGQSRRWDLWIDTRGDGAALAAAAQAPSLPAADPQQAIDTGVWDDIAPAGTPAMAEYDPWTRNLYDAYGESIRHERDYGAMNWGDWFGERHVNWGNHEYDTVNQLLIQFARTGDPEYFHTAEAAARHSAEVDVVHHVNADLAEYFTRNWPTKGYPPRPGMVHEHCVGHVGCFYPIETVRKLLVEHRIGNSDRPYLCLDPFNLGHIWTQGLVRYYFLTGDAFVRETVEAIGDNLARLVEDGIYDFAIERLAPPRHGRRLRTGLRRALPQGHAEPRRPRPGTAGPPLRRLALPALPGALPLHHPQARRHGRLHPRHPRQRPQPLWPAHRRRTHPGGGAAGRDLHEQRHLGRPAPRLALHLLPGQRLPWPVRRHRHGRGQRRAPGRRPGAPAHPAPGLGGEVR